MTAREQILGDVRAALKGPRASFLSRSSRFHPNCCRPLHCESLYRTAISMLISSSRSSKTWAENRFACAIPRPSCPAIAELLAQKSAIASNSPFLRKCGITGLAQVHAGFTDRDELKEACASRDIGITSADYALAATGSFVMLSSHNEARLISLVAAGPYRHFSALAHPGESGRTAQRSSPPRRSNQLHGLDHRPQPHRRYRTNPGPRRAWPGRSLCCHRG